MVFIFGFNTQTTAQQKNILKLEKLALNYFNDDDYESAIKLYSTLVSKDSLKADYFFQLGICYIKSGKSKTSLYYFEKAEKLKHSNNKIYYYLGTTNHLLHNFDAAIQYFTILKTKFKEQEIDNPIILNEINSYIKQCNIGKKIIQHPLQISIENLGENINSQYPEYIPLITADEKTLIFTTRRPLNENSKKDLVDNHYFEDVYISKKVNGIWQKSTPIKGLINTLHHDACVSLNYDGKKLYLYKEQSGDIYYSKFKDEISGWNIPEPLNENINTKYWEPSAYESNEDCTMYFSSNRPGGFGGLDIYKSTMINGEWGPAVNLGPIINTEEDEDAPFVHKENNSLYFSSKGHYNMGGYDIFISKFDSNYKTWSTPQNIGFPLNSAGDDIFFSWNSNLSTVYFSSIREDSYGEKDLYKATSLQKEKPIAIATDTIKIQPHKISGKVFSEIKKTNSPHKTYVYLTAPTNGFLEENLDTVNKFKYESIPFDDHKIVFENPFVNFKNENISILDSSFIATIQLKEGNVYLLNSHNEIIKHTTSDTNGHFQFDNLPPFEDFKLVFSTEDNLKKTSTLKKSLSQFNINEDSASHHYIIYGKTINNTLDTVKIDKNYRITNMDGYFAFTQIIDPSVLVKDKNENPVLSFTISADSCLFVTKHYIPKFKYNKLPLDTNIIHLKFEFSGRIKAKTGNESIHDLALILIDSKGNIIAKTKSNAQGHFKFSKLSPDNYYVLFEKNNINLKAEIIQLSDNFNSLSKSTANKDVPIFKIIDNLLIKINQDSIHKVKVEKSSSLSSEYIIGKTFIKNTNLPASNHIAYLLNNKNDFISQTKTNSNGYFAFKNLPIANYSIFYPNITPKINTSISYVSSDYELVIPKELSSNHKNLIVYGKLNGTISNPLPTVFLINSNGKINSTLTDKNGHFAFVKIENSNYSVIIKPNSCPKLSIQPMIDLTDRCLFIPKATVKKFKYNKIEGHTSFNVLHYELQGKITSKIKSEPINDIALLLIDSKGTIIEKTTSNENGHFKFNKLIVDDYYIVFENQNYNLKAELNTNYDASFFSLKDNEKHFLNEKVYFDYKSDLLNDSSKLILGTILKTLSNNLMCNIKLYAHTDHIGNKHYNYNLAKRRGYAVYNYLISLGLDKKRILIIPKGDQEQIINSTDKVKNKINRRVEFELNCLIVN